MTDVRWEPDARGDLRRYRRWLAREAGAEIAGRCIAALIDQVDELRHFPDQGTPRDDLGRGVRTRVFRRTIVIAYAVRAQEIVVLHVYSRGRNITAADFNDPE
jgi:toxin ParE1/3/4